MSHYIYELTQNTDKYGHLAIGKLSEIALNVFPCVLREFNFDMLMLPPHTCQTFKSEMRVVVPLNVNCNKGALYLPNPYQCALELTAHRKSQFVRGTDMNLTVNNRGRIDTVNINTAKENEWIVPNIVSYIHKGLAWLTNFQLARDRGVFFKQNEHNSHYYFTTVLHEFEMYGEMFILELAIMFTKEDFSIRPNK